jgi:hypothetical protein
MRPQGQYTEWYGAYPVSSLEPRYGSAVERGQEEEVKFVVRKHWYFKTEVDFYGRH